MLARSVTRVGLALLLALSACSPAPAPLPPPTPTHPAPAATALPSPKDDAPRPPIARKQPKETVIHGRTLVDDYFWLREKGAPAVDAYLTAENAYTDAMTKRTEPLASALYAEMLAHVKEDDTTPPYKDGAWLYAKRFEKGKQYAIHGRRAKPDAKGEVILDLNEIAKGATFVDVESMAVSDDGKKLAYLLDTVGFRQFTLKVKDLATGEHLSEAIPRVDYVAWAKDDRTLFYVTEDARTKRPNKLFRHVVGEDAAKDALVYEEKDEMFDLDLERTRSKAFAVVTSASQTTTEVRLLDTAKPTAPPRLVVPREQDHEYYVDHRGDLLYIRTNSGGRNFRIVTAAVVDPRRAAWKELVPHRDDVMIEEHHLFKDFMVTEEREDALPHLSVLDLKTGKSHRVDQPEPLYDIEPEHNEEFGASALRFRYESLRTPLSWVTVDMKTNARTVLKQTEVPGYDASAYETKRIAAPARDGTRVPVSLVFKKGAAPDGTHPMLLHAYGSYGYTVPLSFSSERLALLDRGFVYAHAHIRGGGDMGKKWHDQGRRRAKMNTFTDFIDVAEHLKKEGWAKKDALVVTGASAGGLLAGAVTNMRPDLFTIVLAYVPFVDVINTELDESLPLTVNEFEEWGNPKTKGDFEYMWQYSPYDNVAKKAYPAMLVRTSYHDSEVMYWEPAKWVAKLRATKTDDRPLLFKVNMDPAGHEGHAGRYDRLRDTAFDYAFVLSQLGIPK
jgi:oligopeptidase B